MILQPIVEGQGDEAAVPLLLRQLRDDFINSLTYFRNMIEHLKDQRNTTSPGCRLYGS